MSQGLAISIRVPLDRFRLEVEWETAAHSLGVFGHSGAGKTTLLEALAGLRRGVQGRIELGGKTWLDTSRNIDLPPERRGVGYVPQEALLFPHRNVLGNLLAGARRAKRLSAGSPPLARVLEVLELSDFRDRDVSALSGGEKRRVALGRALCSGPALLLLDEPLSGLEVPLRARILPYLLRVQEEFDLPTLYVSHDATEISLLTREVVVLESGRRVACGPPGEVLTSRSIFPMARAEGFENVFRGRVSGKDGATATVELEPALSVRVPGAGLAMGGEAVFGIRAEEFILSLPAPEGLSAQNILPGIIREIRQEGDGGDGNGGVVVVIALGRSAFPAVATITSRALRQLNLQAGQPIHLVWKAHACRILAVR